MFNEKISYDKIANNLKDYDFKCKLINVSVNVEIYNKDTDQLMSTAPMSIVVHNGTMNQEYSAKFFSDLSRDVKTAFATQVLNVNKKEIEQSGKT